MRPQSQVLRTLRAPGSQVRLEHIVARGARESRTALGREVCAQFGFVDARGSAQLAGCLKALGALGFSASALRLRVRDTWMGWSDEQRTAHLHRVVCLSRFLIRPAVRCRHLASHVLGRVLRRVGEDFEARYHYRPWLVESFVEPEHDGVSFKAANFVCVGHSAGRGRCDRHHEGARTVKSVYIYELTPHWRRHLGVAPVDVAASLSPGEGLDSTVWAANEFGGAPLGDKRLSARLVRSATLLASCPGHAFSGHTDPDRAAVKGYYRFIEHPAQSQVTPTHIVAPHRTRTVQRMREHDTVLCIQDGTDLNFATRPGCEGLSIIGRNQTSAKTLGLHLHLTLAVSSTGLPLGVLRCGFDEPPVSEASHGQGSRESDEEPAGEEVAALTASRPVNKTRRWLEGLRDVAQAASTSTASTPRSSSSDTTCDAGASRTSSGC